jgi:hypothetical protein
MTSRLATNYTITWAGNNFTITYASIYSPLVFSDAEYIAYVIPNSSTYVNIGPADGAVTLNWSLNTNLGAVSASDLLVKVAALTSTTASFNSITTDSITSKTTNGNLVLTGNGTGSVRVDDLLGLSCTPDTTCTGLQFSPSSGVKQVVCYSFANNNFQYCGLGMKSGAMAVHLNATSTNLDFDVGTSSSTEATKMRLTGTGTLVVDGISSLTTNGHLDLVGNGSGIVRVLDQLAVDSITTFTTNTDLSLQGNGTGVVSITDGLKLPATDASLVQQTITNNGHYTASITFSGPFSSNQSATLHVYRFGNLIMGYVTAVSAAAAGVGTFASSASAIPSGGRPSTGITFSKTLITNSGGSATIGRVDIGDDGSITIFPGASGNFGTSGNNGWNAFSFNYALSS